MECLRQEAATANSSASCGCKVREAVDEPRGKGVPRTYAVHDIVDIVAAGDQELLPV